jgi:DNA-binding XRE family transcriptional regulator
MNRSILATTVTKAVDACVDSCYVTIMSTDALAMFPGRLTLLRQARRLSQAEVARRTGLHPTAVSHFESGARRPSLSNLFKLVHLLGSPGYLFGLQAWPDGPLGAS